MRSSSLLQQERSSLYGHARFYREIIEYNFLRGLCGENWLPELTVMDRVIPNIILQWPEPLDVALKLTCISIGDRIAGFPYRRGQWPFTPPDIRLISGRVPPSLQQCMDGDRILILQPDWSPALQISKIAMILGSWLNETLIEEIDTTTRTHSSSCFDLRRRKSCPSFDEITFSQENNRISSERAAWNEEAWDDCDSEFAEMNMVYLEDVPPNYTRSHWEPLTKTTSE